MVISDLLLVKDILMAPMHIQFLEANVCSGLPAITLITKTILCSRFQSPENSKPFQFSLITSPQIERYCLTPPT